MQKGKMVINSNGLKDLNYKTTSNMFLYKGLLVYFQSIKELNVPF